MDMEGTVVVQWRIFNTNIGFFEVGGVGSGTESDISRYSILQYYPILQYSIPT